jgi:hypothetical protein
MQNKAIECDVCYITLFLSRYFYGVCLAPVSMGVTRNLKGVVVFVLKGTSNNAAEGRGRAGVEHFLIR